MNKSECEACRHLGVEVKRIDGMVLCTECANEYRRFMAEADAYPAAEGVNPTPANYDRQWEEFADFAMSHASC